MREIEEEEDESRYDESSMPKQRSYEARAEDLSKRKNTHTSERMKIHGYKDPDCRTMMSKSESIRTVEANGWLRSHSLAAK